MGANHTETPSPPVPNSTKAVLGALLAPLMIAGVIGMILLWPDQSNPVTPGELGTQASLIDADVRDIAIQPCSNDPSGTQCSFLTLALTSGVNSGLEVAMELPQGPGQPPVEVGDEIIVGAADDGVGGFTYYFADFQRSIPLAWLGAAFVVLVIAVGRWRGVGALIGLGITGLVIAQFMLPSILEGRSPLLVALAGSAVIVFLALYIAHGFNARTTTAIIGTLASLGIVAFLAGIAVEATHLTGLAHEESTYVQSFAGQIDLRGLILGGMIIGGLGILNDMTISQSSSVREVHLAQPGLNRRQLYTSGMRVGRDHIASTVYTLVLAYAGAALPLFLLFTLSDRGFTDVIATELVGEEVVRTLVGSFGLIAAVPITTALSAWVEKTRPVVAQPVLQTVESDEPIAPLAPARPRTPSVDGLRAKSRQRWWSRKPKPFERNMTRRERKFWEGD